MTDLPNHSLKTWRNNNVHRPVLELQQYNTLFYVLLVKLHYNLFKKEAFLTYTIIYTEKKQSCAKKKILTTSEDK